jgi:hypothetical protein
MSKSPNNRITSRSTLARRNIVLITSVVWIGLMVFLPLAKEELIYMYCLFRAVLGSEIQQERYQRSIVYYVTWGFFTHTALTFSLFSTIMPLYYRVALLFSFGCTLYIFQQINALKNLMSHLQFVLLLGFFCPFDAQSAFRFTHYSLVGVSALLITLNLNQSKYDHYIFHYIRSMNQYIFQLLKDIVTARDFSNQTIMQYKYNSLAYLESQKYLNLNANSDQSHTIGLYHRTMGSIVNGNYYLLLNYSHLIKTQDNSMITFTRKTKILSLIMDTLMLSGSMMLITLQEFSRRTINIQDKILKLYEILETQSNLDFTLRIYEVLTVSGSIAIQLAKLDPLLRNL